MPIKLHHARRRKRVVILWGGLLLALYALAGQGIFQHPYFGVTLRGDRVARATPGGPAEQVGVSAGDVLLAVNGTPVDGIPFLTESFYSGALGRAVQLDLSGPYGRKSLVIQGQPSTPRMRLKDATSFVTGLGFLLIGMYTALHPARRLTFLFFFLCSGFSIALLPIGPPEPPFAPMLTGSARSLATLFLPPMILHFFLVFPREQTIVRRSPVILKWIYVPALIALAPLVYVCTAFWWHPPASGTLTLGLEVLSALSFGLFSVLALVSLIYGYLHVQSRAERRRYSVILGGTLIGIAPSLAAILVHVLYPRIELPWESFVYVGLLLIPASFTYAIARHQIFDIEVFVKRSAAFSMLTACLVVITVGIYVLFGVVLESLTGQRSTWVMLLSLVIIAGVFSPLRRRIERIVDRSFFRERYDDRRVLRELSQALPGILKLQDLLREVVEKLARTLRVREAAIYIALPEHDHLRLAYASGIPPEDLDLPPFPQRLLQIIRKAERPLRTLEVEESLPFGALQESEERILTTFHSGAMVPFITGSELLAVLVLGRRSGGEPYGTEDLELLHAIAGQVTVAMQNSLLHMKEIQRERIERELGVARDLQRHLLPLSDPIFTRMEIAGATIQCYEVGGDFYDYLHLPKRRLGIVVGDVSGKGVPAALIMATVSGALRSEVQHHPEPSTLMRRLNAQACSTLEPGQFLSLFYGVVSTDTMTLTYANAGHPPPIALLPDGKVLHLATGGMLLGVDPTVKHAADHLECPRGTVILFPTDGLVEASRGEVEFGEQRMIDLVRERPTASAAAIRSRIMEAAESFLEGQVSDDLTLIVMKVL